MEADTCTPVVIPNTSTITTTIILSGNPQQKSPEYFDNPDNVIFVSSLGAAVLISTGGMIAYFVGKRRLCKTTRVDHEM